MSLLERARRSARDRLARNWRPHAAPSRAPGPVASFTFDDFPRSAAHAGAAILEGRGLRGTFFAAGGLEGGQEEGLDQFTREDLMGLAQAQHEIGCHTYSHLRLPGARPDVIAADLDRSQAYVREVLGDYRLTSFAYPFGDVSLAAKAQIGRRFPIARGIFPGINAGHVDFQQLKALPVERRSYSPDTARRLMEAAQARNGWLVFFTHDVSDTPSPYGITPDALARLADEVLARGFEVLPLKHAAARVRFGEPQAA